MLSTLRKPSKLTYSSVGVGIVVSVPILAAAQGAYFLINFRRNHGDAPYPHSPSRGIVIVSPYDSTDVIGDQQHGFSSSHHIKTQASKILSDKNHLEDVKRNTRYLHDKWLSLWKNKKLLNFTRDKSYKENNDPQIQPFRIFVVGDSLAAGVGSTSGTPILPEAIARSLSKALGGQPVHWTCHGTPGKYLSIDPRPLQFCFYISCAQTFLLFRCFDI